MKLVIFGKDSLLSNERIPFGPWCLVGNEDRYKETVFQFSNDVFAKDYQYESIELEVENLSESLLAFLSIYLNKVNDTDWSLSFWRVMVFPWLIAFIQNYLIQYLRFEKYINERGSEFIFQSSPDKTPEFINTYDFYVNGLQSIEYLEWTYSDIIRRCFPYLQRIEHQKHDNRSHKNIPRNHTLKYKIRNFIKSLLGVKNVYGIKPIEAFALGSLIKRGKHLNNQPESPPSPQQQKHKSIIVKDINWESLIEQTIPKCFLNIKKLQTPVITPNYTFQIVSGTLLYTEEEQKYQLAKYVESGGILVPCQHGSNYGVLSFFSNQKLIEYKYDHYFSWGWRNHQGSKNSATGLSSPLVEKLQKIHTSDKKNKEIILVGTITMPLFYHIISSQQPCQTLEYRNEKIEFIKSLLPENFNRLQYRYYPSNDTYNCLKDLDFVKDYFANLKICEGDLHPKLGKASLVVSDHPGTTFFLTMGANIPTVGYWNPKHWSFTSEAEQFFRQLKEQKIVFDSPAVAAEHVNFISNDISKWWHSSAVQKARKNWSHQYARSSGNWKQEWEQQIKQLNETILPG